MENIVNKKAFGIKQAKLKSSRKHDVRVKIYTFVENLVICIVPVVFVLLMIVCWINFGYGN